jgi:hypothetical protein
MKAVIPDTCVLVRCPISKAARCVLRRVRHWIPTRTASPTPSRASAEPMRTSPPTGRSWSVRAEPATSLRSAGSIPSSPTLRPRSGAPITSQCPEALGVRPRRGAVSHHPLLRSASLVGRLFAWRPRAMNCNTRGELDICRSLTRQGIESSTLFLRLSFKGIPKKNSPESVIRVTGI